MLFNATRNIWKMLKKKLTKKENAYFLQALICLHVLLYFVDINICYMYSYALSVVV